MDTGYPSLIPDPEKPKKPASPAKQPEKPQSEKPDPNRNGDSLPSTTTQHVKRKP